MANETLDGREVELHQGEMDGWGLRARHISLPRIGLHGKKTYLYSMKESADTSVLYNADCPVCNFEIQHYARYADKMGLPIQFDDLNSDARVQWGLDADAAAKRLYVLHQGMMTSGIPAFRVLWSQMPRYRGLAWAVGLPGIFHATCVIYDHVLGPAIYRLHLRRLRKNTSQQAG